MRAKIMLLNGNAAGKVMCQYAQQILTEVSASFGHSISLMQEKIGEESLEAYQEALTQETVEACQDCHAVFLGDAACPGALDLYDALDLPIRIRSLCVPEALCGRHEAPVSLWLAQILSLDPETLREGAQAAFRFAKEMEAGIVHVAPSGAAKTEWEAALRVQEVSQPQVPLSSLSAPDAASALVTSPFRMGMLLCPPYAGSILHASATALCTQPLLMHDLSFHDHLGVYAPFIPPVVDDEELNPAAAALSVAKMLRFSLDLPVEAGCVEAAVANVLSAGEEGQKMTDLICDQISVAGELMYKSPLPH
ncbi:MAG: hypothetical protein E7329_01895 [Clostridiales bacterium]|nr:hypothetical protein [Clostridiales bacterium]